MVIFTLYILRRGAIMFTPTKEIHHETTRRNRTIQRRRKRRRA